MKYLSELTPIPSEDTPELTLEPALELIQEFCGAFILPNPNLFPKQTLISRAERVVA